ncbi:hypothetical protein IV203_018279 [Nitzschia inconspicua]|uniref:Uncharacterized protein n=1 Tax=Nitzschia inconspicua TaxID=303405 RepID=A0A9K3M4U7_9STRA|nr:hypothetical protein IV203_018279 [Nitzschia inconspicua]
MGGIIKTGRIDPHDVSVIDPADLPCRLANSESTFTVKYYNILYKYRKIDSAHCHSYCHFHCHCHCDAAAIATAIACRLYIVYTSQIQSTAIATAIPCHYTSQTDFAIVGKNDKTPTLTENAEKHSEAANHAEKRLIPGEPGRRTYADVLRGCEDLKTDVPHGCGIADRNNENVHRGCKSIADGVVCTNKIGDGVVSAKVRKKRNDKKGTEETVTFLE